MHPTEALTTMSFANFLRETDAVGMFVFVLLVGMLSWLWVTLRRRRALAEPPPLSDDELRRARELLGSTPK